MNRYITFITAVSCITASLAAPDSTMTPQTEKMRKEVITQINNAHTQFSNQSINQITQQLKTDLAATKSQTSFRAMTKDNQKLIEAAYQRAITMWQKIGAGWSNLAVLIKGLGGATMKGSNLKKMGEALKTQKQSWDASIESAAKMYEKITKLKLYLAGKIQIQGQAKETLAAAVNQTNAETNKVNYLEDLMLKAMKFEGVK